MSPVIAAGAVVLASLLAPMLVVVTGYVLAYAAHSLLVVLEQTGAGADAVHWPDEGIREWLWKGFYLGWLLLLWLIPVGLFIAWLRADSVPAALSRFILISVFFLWLVWPISMLSSLSSVSGW